MDQRTEFQNRINRVADLNRDRTQQVGLSKTLRTQRSERINSVMERQDAWDKKHTRHGDADPKTTKSWPHIFSVVLAISIGGISAIAARFTLFQSSRYMGVDLSPSIGLTLDIFLAIAIGFWVRELVSLSALRQIGAQFLGIFLALMTMHNVVHQLPDSFARLLSPEWVEHVKQSTQPGTLQFREAEPRI